MTEAALVSPQQTKCTLSTCKKLRKEGVSHSGVASSAAEANRTLIAGGYDDFDSLPIDVDVTRFSPLR